MTMNPHKIVLHAPVRGKDSEVTLDGQPVRGLQSITVEAAVDRLTLVTMTFLADVNVVDPMFRDPAAEYAAAGGLRRHD